ncbi:MAG: mechanosensitive ion channel family protein [Pseudomonadota bacterium]
MQAFLEQIWSYFPAPMKDKLQGYVEGFWTILPNIVFAVLFLVLVWVIVALATWVVRRVTRNLRSNLRDVAVLLTRVALWTVGLLSAATIAFPTLSIANIFAAAGVGGLAIAFAARDTLENFFAGVNLLVRKTFDDGDYVECEGIEGQVENITVRETWIRQTDGQLVVAPNKTFFQNPLTIRTNRDVRRTTVICGVAYGEDVDQSRKVIEDAVASCDTVLSSDHPVQIFAQEFGDSAINFEVTWWTRPKPVDIRRSRDQVVSTVKRALDEAGIEIPFPYRTLTFAEPLHTQAQDEDARSDKAA